MTTDNETNLSLWKFFTEDAARIKARMWLSASWMFTLQSGILAFMGKYFSTSNDNRLLVENHIMVTISSVIGIALSIYTAFMIKQHGDHIRGMWNRAAEVRRKIEGLSEIWFLRDAAKVKQDLAPDQPIDTSLPRVAKTLVWLCLGFTLVFTSLFILVFFLNRNNY